MKDKLNIQLITAAILSLGGLAMLFCGVFIDPEGQIHESLLIGFGEVATFAGALFGIDYTYKKQYNHGNNNTNQTKVERRKSKDESCKRPDIPPLRSAQPPHL